MLALWGEAFLFDGLIYISSFSDYVGAQCWFLLFCSMNPPLNEYNCTPPPPALPLALQVLR